MIDKEVRAPEKFQTPPEVKIALGAAGVAQIKIVSTGEPVLARTRYANNTEYFYHKTTSPGFGTLTTITCATLDATDSEIDTWVDSSNYSTSFNHARLNPRWTKGKRSSTRTSHLYWAADPDSTATPPKRIGVLVEESSTGTLAAVVYYKQDQVRADGQLWSPAVALPTPWTLTRVRDRNGNISNEPADIDGSGNWTGWWTLMGAE